MLFFIYNLPHPKDIGWIPKAKFGKKKKEVNFIHQYFPTHPNLILSLQNKLK